MNKLSPIDSKAEGGFFAALIAFIVLMPICNGAFGQDSSLFVSSYQLGVWGKYLCYAVLAMSLNLLWGYTGLLCLGQCLFFALGGYAFGMYLMLMIGPDPVYNTALPDFMDFRGYEKLPTWWEPFNNPFVAALAAMLVPGVVALIFGTLAFRSRIKGVYFSILTQALTYAAFLLFNRNESGFGGTNGFTDFKFVLGLDIRTDEASRWLFIASGVLLLLVYWGIALTLRSKFGKVQQAVRDSENRVRFSGYSTTHFKVFIFVVSAMIAGAAGALYVPQAGIINPGEMSVKNGLDVVVWVAVGGRGSKMGPIIGAIFVSFLKSWASGAFAEYWLIILGSVFIFVVLFMPKGIVGLWEQLRSYIAKKRSSSQEEATV